MSIGAAIEFPVYVNGKRLLATATEQADNPVQHIFTVRFTDGYEDEFCYDEDRIEGTDKEKSLSYAIALRNDLPIIADMDTNKLYHVFQENIDGELTNIWVIEKPTDRRDISYGVYYNQYYRF